MLEGNTIKFALITALILGFPGISKASAYESLFPESVEADTADLVRTGVSKLKVGYIFNVYVAAFYQPADKGPSEVLGDHPKHLEIYYLRNISKNDFIEAGNDMLVEQYGKDILDQLRPGLDAINPLYDDVKKKDRYSLTYIPGRGTELKRNGESLGIVPGDEFARKYFSIWLGEDIPYRSFRDQLIGL